LGFHLLKAVRLAAASAISFPIYTHVREDPDQLDKEAGIEKKVKFGFDQWDQIISTTFHRKR